MLSGSLNTAVKLVKQDKLFYTFVFSGKALEAVMLRYVIIEDISKMTKILVGSYQEMQKLYNENIDDLLKIVVDSTLETYKPFEWSNK